MFVLIYPLYCTRYTINFVTCKNYKVEKFFFRLDICLLENNCWKIFKRHADKWIVWLIKWFLLSLKIFNSWKYFLNNVEKLEPNLLFFHSHQFCVNNEIMFYTEISTIRCWFVYFSFCFTSKKKTANQKFMSKLQCKKLLFPNSMKK